jgi:hypothetical protein
VLLAAGPEGCTVDCANNIVDPKIISEKTFETFFMRVLLPNPNSREITNLGTNVLNLGAERHGGKCCRDSVNQREMKRLKESGSPATMAGVVPSEK